MIQLPHCKPTNCGPGSSVGIATGYGLDGPGIESRWGRDFPHLTRPALGPPSLLYNGYRVFPGRKEWPGSDAGPSTPSSAVIVKGWRYTSAPPIGRTALGRASVSVQGCPLPLPLQ